MIVIADSVVLCCAVLSQVFELAKAQLRVEEYAVGQTTLEQIFNHFASSQENPEVAAAAQ